MQCKNLGQYEPLIQSSSQNKVLSLSSFTISILRVVFYGHVISIQMKLLFQFDVRGQNPVSYQESNEFLKDCSNILEKIVFINNRIAREFMSSRSKV